MKLIQTRVPDGEYEALRRAAEKEHRPMQDIIREALRARLLSDRYVPDDPLFSIFPLAKRKKGKVHWAGEDHDELLYPPSP